MAREHLYKAKRKDNGEWVYGYYVKAEKLNKDGYEHFIIEEDCEGETHLVIPNTVCEYTGLKDKNGTKIFEHDIVKTKYGRLCEVVWLTAPSFCGYDLKPLECKNPYPTLHDLYLPDNLEVVGNKFDKDWEVQDEQAN